MLTSIFNFKPTIEPSLYLATKYNTFNFCTGIEREKCYIHMLYSDCIAPQELRERLCGNGAALLCTEHTWFKLHAWAARTHPKKQAISCRCKFDMFVSNI